MKKIIIALAAIILLASCSTNKAETEIKDYITKNINDPASYEPVSFSEQLADITTVYDDGYINSLNTQIEALKPWKDVYRNNNTEKYIEVLNKLSAMYSAQNAYFDAYKNKPCGYKVKHTFRRKNKAGGVVMDSITFRFDSSLTLRDFAYNKRLNKD